LKRLEGEDYRGKADVAPRAGAWIETDRAATEVQIFSGSPLAQGRGLKRQWPGLLGIPVGSPLAQGRGLKLSGLF